MPSDVAAQETVAVKASPAVQESPAGAAPAQPLFEGGFVHLPGGEWLGARSQPAACKGAASVAGLKGWLVPDRAQLRRVAAAGDCWFADRERPFLTRLDAMPDDTLHVASEKVLVAEVSTRRGARSVRLIPFALRGNLLCTEFQAGWVVAATRSRTTRVVIEDGETLTVRPEALVAWRGNVPTGFCPKLSVLDLLLPRNPSTLSFSFHGPATVWFEGSATPVTRNPGARTPVF